MGRTRRSGRPLDGAIGRRGAACPRAASPGRFIAAARRPPSRGRARSRSEAGPRPRDAALLEAILLGAAYPLGLIRTGLEGTEPGDESCS